jgi:hypothetical protein
MHAGWNGLRRAAAIVGLALALAGCHGDGPADDAAVEPEAPASTTTQIHVFVAGINAQPMDGVRVEVVDGPAAATTDAEGNAQIELAEQARTLLKFTKAGYSDMFKSVAFQPEMTGALVSVRMRVREAAQTLDASTGGVLTGADGARIEVAGGTLVDAETGALLSGLVEIAMTPIDVSSDEIDAFPGRFVGIATDGSSSLIATYGTTEFVLTQGGRRVNLAPGRTAQILLPIYTPMHTAASAVVAGDVIPLWSLDERTGTWLQEGSGVVVAAEGSPTGLALSATVGHFSWWNCDISEDTGRVNVEIETPEVDDEDRDPAGPPDDGDEPPPDIPPKDILDYWEERADPNKYIISPRLIRIDGRTSDALLRGAGIDFEAAFGGEFNQRREQPQGISYAGPSGGLLVPAGRGVILTACASVKRGGPTYRAVLACGTSSVTVAPDGQANVTIKLQIDDPRNLPVILTHPSSASVEVGQTATFAVVAERVQGGTRGLTYQWTRNGVPIDGAVAASYTPPAQTVADSGAFYSAIVSAPTGFTRSLAARMLVSAPPPPPLPPAAGDRFVNAATGNDANPGSAAAPWRTISFALGATPAGGVTWLQDGTWAGDTDPALATTGYGLNCRIGGTTPISDGLRLRAVNRGAAIVHFDSQSGICLRQAELSGIRFVGPLTAARRGIRITGPGASTLSDVALDNASTAISGGANVNISADGLASYGHAGSNRISTLQVQDEGTTVTVLGGAFDGVTQHGVSGTSGGCVLAAVWATNGGRLVLDGVALRADPSTTVSESLPSYGVHACDGATLELRNGTRVEGFTIGARIFSSTFEVADSALLGNGTGMGLSGSASRPGVATLRGAFVDNSTLAGITVGGGSRLTLDPGTKVRNNGGHGVAFSSTQSQMRIDGAELSGNGAAGLSYFGADCRVRNTSVFGNTGGGIVIENFSNVAPAPCDLGTAASPGGNSVLSTPGNSGLRVRTVGVAVQAVGNTWVASEQGADAQGRYSVPAGQTANVITGPTTGRNVRIDAAGSSVTLAQ